MSTNDDVISDPGRRNFGRGLLGLAGMLWEAWQGAEHMSLADLDKMPDDTLAEIVPVFRETEPLEMRDDGLYLVDDREGATLVYALTPTERQMVEQYGRGLTLRRIAEVAAEMNRIPTQQAFRQARELFLCLAKKGWCHPGEAARGPSEGTPRTISFGSTNDGP